MNRRRTYRGYLVDIEGVLVRDKRYQPIEGSPAWFNGLAERGLAVCLVSNNTTHRPEELIADLRAAGFAATPQQLVSALELGASLLASWGKRRLRWLGTPRLAPWWRERGFALEGDGPCQAVVLGVNPELAVADLDAALASLRDDGAELVALHRNLFYLDAHGQPRLGPGAWCAALAAAARHEPVTIGKPHERIYREALKRIGVPAGEVLFISDDPQADLVTAKRLGMGTAFVLSGKYPDHAILGRMDQGDWPDIISDRAERLEP